MKTHLKTILSECKRRIAKDPSGLTTTRYLTGLVKQRILDDRQADWYFFRAEKAVYVDPYPTQLRNL